MGKKKMLGKTRRTIVLLVAVGATLVLSSTAAFAALRMGTNNSETLTGTNSADIMTGKGGNDTLKGLAGNDVYHFANGFGTDTLEELKKYGTKPGGTDTLNFSKVTTPMTIYLTPQWAASGNYLGNQAWTYDSSSVVHKVQLGSSLVENAVGGAGSDFIGGGGGTNTLKPGGGFSNSLRDFGGWNDGAGGHPEIPASNDAYKGFGAAPGGAINEVADWGGTADKLVLPGESSDYYIEAVDLDGTSATEESMVIYDPANNTTIRVFGQFGDYYTWTSNSGLQGNIEQLVFADGVFSTAAQVQNLMDASAARADSTTTKAAVEEAADQASPPEASSDPTRPPDQQKQK